MNKVSRSVFFFGLYSSLMGVTLLFFPKAAFTLFDLPANGEPWLNLLGFVLICSSYYYIRSAHSGNVQFATYTIHTRFAAPLVVFYLVAADKADWHFISFGIVDGLGGLWTLYELKKQR